MLPVAVPWTVTAASLADAAVPRVIAAVPWMAGASWLAEAVRTAESRAAEAVPTTVEVPAADKALLPTAIPAAVAVTVDVPEATDSAAAKLRAAVPEISAVPEPPARSLARVWAVWPLTRTEPVEAPVRFASVWSTWPNSAGPDETRLADAKARGSRIGPAVASRVTAPDAATTLDRVPETAPWERTSAVPAAEASAKLWLTAPAIGTIPVAVAVA